MYCADMADICLNDQVLQNLLLGKNVEVFSILQDADPCYLAASNNTSTLFHLAVEHNNKDLLQYLISIGVDVNAQNSTGETPIMLAVKRKCTDTVSLLLKANADICVPNMQGKCLLGRVFDSLDKEINFDMRKLILDHTTANFLCKSPYIKTELFYNNCTLDSFVSLRDTQIIKLLLDVGSPVNIRNKISGRTALHEAVQQLHVNTVRLLLKYGADVNARDFSGKKPLAVINDYNSGKETLEIVQILLNAGAELIDHDPTEILMQSILSNGNKQLIRSVLQCNINWYTKNKKLRMPIEYLFENKNPGIHEELTNFKFDPNICSDKTTLMHCAASTGNANFVQLLLERGAKVNVKDCYNRSPLFVAVDPLKSIANGITEENLRNRFNCIAILLDNGADPQIFKENINYIYIDIFDHPPTINIATALMRPVLIQLALHQVSGRVIESFMLNEIEKRQRFKSIFDLNKQQLQEMKQIKIDESVNLFDFLVVEKVSIYAQNKILITNLTSIMKECNIDSCYYWWLQKRFLKLTQLIAVNEIFIKSHNISVIDIAEKIMNYV